MNASTPIPAHDHGRLALAYAVVIGLALVAGALLALGLGMQPLAGRGVRRRDFARAAAVLPLSGPVH